MRAQIEDLKYLEISNLHIIMNQSLYFRKTHTMFKNRYFANSVLDCLYLIRQFREKIYQTPYENKNVIVKALQNIFRITENKDSDEYLNTQIEKLLDYLFESTKFLSNSNRNHFE